MYRNSTQTNMFSFFFFFKCPNTTFFNEFLNSPHESATYVHNEFFVIRYSNLLPFVTHVVVFFVFFYAHKAQVAGREGVCFFGLAYAPACVAVWCAKASLVPVCAYECGGMCF